jgi:hypothetical protein
MPTVTVPVKEPQTHPENIVEMSWDPITRIVGRWQSVSSEAADSS